MKSSMFLLLALCALLSLSGCINVRVGIVEPTRVSPPDATATPQRAEFTPTPWRAEPTVPPPDPTPTPMLLLTFTPISPVTTDEVHAARDAAMAYLRARYGEQGPPPDLAWRVILEEVSAGSWTEGGFLYNYSAGDDRYPDEGYWRVRVFYPLSVPEPIYRVVVDNPVTQFHWEGEIDASGRVTETVTPRSTEPTLTPTPPPPPPLRPTLAPPPTPAPLPTLTPPPPPPLRPTLAPPPTPTPLPTLAPRPTPPPPPTPTPSR
jgi:hypothetical protein